VLAYWKALKVGDYLSLKDFQSLAEGGAEGLDCKVAEIRDMAVGDSTTAKALASYRLYELERVGQGPLFLLVLSAGEDFELRSYFVPPGLVPGTRDQLVDRGETWLFLPPPDPEDFISSDLELAPFPDLPALPESGGPVKRVWERSGFGQTLYGSYTGRAGEVPVIVAEYETREEGAPNPLLLVLEENWLDGRGKAIPEGGLVTVLLGSPLDPGSIEVWPA
jgi:hypothetical protein